MSKSWRISRKLNVRAEECMLNCLWTDFLYAYDKDLFKKDPLDLFEKLLSVHGLINTVLCQLSASLGNVVEANLRSMCDKLSKRGVNLHSLFFVHHLDQCQRCLNVLTHNVKDWEFGWGFKRPWNDLREAAAHLATLELHDSHFTILKKKNQELYSKLKIRTNAEISDQLMEPDSMGVDFNYQRTSSRLNKKTAILFVIKSSPTKAKPAELAKPKKKARPEKKAKPAKLAQAPQAHACIYKSFVEENACIRKHFNDIAQVMAEKKNNPAGIIDIDKMYQILMARFVLKDMTLEELQEMSQDLVSLRNQLFRQK